MTTTDIKSMITNDNDAVVTEIEIAASPSRVFQALTDRAQALQGGAATGFETTRWEMDPRPGGQWRSVSGELKERAPVRIDHHGEILEIDPPRLFSSSWYASWHELPSHRTVARRELTPTKSGAHLRVTRSGLTQRPAAGQVYSQGWPGFGRVN